MQNLHSSARTAAKTMFKRWGLIRQAQIATILMLAAGLIVSSCENPNVTVPNKYVNSNNVRFEIFEIDSCQYVGYSVGGTYPVFSHKGNCKYCLNRKK